MKTEVNLTYPIEVAGRVTKTLFVRRPKLRDYEALESIANGELEKDIRLLANLTEISPDEVRELDMIDFHKVNKVIAGFLDQKA